MGLDLLDLILVLIGKVACYFFTKLTGKVLDLSYWTYEVIGFFVFVVFVLLISLYWSY